MAMPIYEPLSSGNGIIYIRLVELTTYTEIGGAAIDSYYFERTIGDSGVWTQVHDGDFSTYQANLGYETSGNTLGETIQFRAKASNIHGWGLMSDPLVVISSSVPEKPIPPVITIENLDVKISWTQPNDNHGQISSYIIRIAAEGTDTFTEETVNCDGSEIMITQL